MGRHDLNVVLGQIRFHKTMLSNLCRLLCVVQVLPTLRGLWRRAATNPPSMANALILKTNLNQGVPGPEHFETRQYPRPKLGDGILVQLLVVSADPYMRYRIRSDGDYKADAPMLGLVAGKVLESNVPEWKVGDLFGAELPYIDIQAVPASKLRMFRRLTGLVTEEPGCHAP